MRTINHTNLYEQFLNSRNQGTFLYRAFQKFLKEVEKKGAEHKCQIQKLKKLSEAHKGETRSNIDQHIPLLTVILQSPDISKPLLWGLSVYIINHALIGPFKLACHDANILTYDWQRCPSHLGADSDLLMARLNAVHVDMKHHLSELTINQRVTDRLGRYGQEVAESFAKKKRP